MKKRVLSLLMALALCFTMLPTAALAQQTGAADVYTTGEDTAVQGKRAVRAAQALIDALPDEVTADNAEEIAAQLANLNETLAALTEEQLAALDMARYEALCEQLAAQVSLTAERGGEHADHPICGAAHKDIGDHTGECADVTWTELTVRDGQLYIGENAAEHTSKKYVFAAYVLPEGSYYLGEDIAPDDVIRIEGTVNLCLNGHRITKVGSDKNQAFAGTIMSEGAASFSLCDCRGGGTITHEEGALGRGIKFSSTTFNMYGGEISGNYEDVFDKVSQSGGGVSMDGGTFTMYGGKITGNHAASRGGGVYVSSGSFTMYNGVISDNTAGTNGGGILAIGSVTIKGGTISDNVTDGNGGGVYVYNNNLTLADDAIITGNAATKGNGGGVYYNSTSSSYELTVSDTAKIEKNSAANGGGIYADKGVLKLTGGTIGDNTVTGSGAGVYAAADCTLTMNGDARIAGNKATGNSARGGGVYVAGTCNMSGNAAITGNSAAYGGVYVNSGAAFTMNGGSITANTAKYGGGVWTATAFEVSGAPKIIDNTDSTDSTGSTKNNVYLSLGTTITIADALAPEARIGVTTGHENSIAPGKYVTVATGAEKGCTADNFSADKGGSCAIKAEGDNVNLYNGQPHRHPICGETCGHTGNEKHTDDIEWKPVSSLSDITEAGSYYLTKDVETSGTWELTDGVNLCLNGHSIKCTNTAEYYPVISIKENITFTLTDCEGGETPHTFKKDDTGRWVQDASGEITVKGVIYRATDVRGSGVEVSGGTFNMYGGTVCGGRLGSGSGVGVYSGNTRAGTFNMYGGRISGNTATATSDGGGGGVYVCNSSTFNMSGNAAVSGNTAQYGSGVYLSSNSTFTMSEHAAISGNSAAMTGGGVFVSSGSITMSSDAAISGNSAGNNGGGIYISYPGTFTMENGTISGNSADKNGGGVYVHNSGAFTMNSGSISGNRATQNGGGVYVENIGTAFTMKDGTIGGSTAADANAAKYGGGVYVKNGTFTMSGGKVTGNSATENGGGVRLDKGTFNMSGSAVVSRNTADGYGGGVDANNGTFTMSGGSITGNSTTGDDANFCGGGGVDVYNGGSFTMSGGSITGNNSLRGGGVELNGSGTMTVSGSVQITDNWQNGTLDSSGVYVKGSSGKPENLYLYSGKTVAIGTDGLNAGAHIGVSTEDWPDPGSPVKIATNATNEESHYTAIFTPDAEEADYKITQENDTVYLSAHEHTWRYALKSGTKDTISATCEECSWNGGSMTIKAPEHTVYGDGKSRYVQIENTNWLPEYPANAVSYRKGTETIEAPTDAGSYTGVLTIGGVEATVDYTIGRKTVSAGDVTFSHTHTTYDGTQKNVANFLVVTVDGKTLTPGTDYRVYGMTSATGFMEGGVQCADRPAGQL